MFRTTALLGLPLFLAALAAPMTFALTRANQVDPSNLYLIIGNGSRTDAVFAKFDLYELGPDPLRFARMVHAPPEIHEMLVSHGVWTLPLGPLSDVCGLT